MFKYVSDGAAAFSEACSYFLGRNERLLPCFPSFQAATWTARTEQKGVM